MSEGFFHIVGINLLYIALAQVVYMTLLCFLHRPLKNAGLVDFGWPSSFTAIAVFFILQAMAMKLVKQQWLLSLLFVAHVLCLVGWRVPGNMEKIAAGSFGETVGKMAKDGVVFVPQW